MLSLYVWHSPREDPEGAHPARGEQRVQREGYVLRIEQHLVSHRERHIPQGGIELRIVPVLQCLQF